MTSSKPPDTQRAHVEHLLWCFRASLWPPTLRDDAFTPDQREAIHTAMASVVDELAYEFGYDPALLRDHAIVGEEFHDHGISAREIRTMPVLRFNPSAYASRHGSGGHPR